LTKALQTPSKNFDLLQTCVVEKQSSIGGAVPSQKLSKLEFQIMDALWTHGDLSIRAIQEAFPAKRRPAYTTVQTTVYRLELKKAVRRTGKVGNFHIFAALLSRDAAQRTLIDDLLVVFGGRSQPLIAHLVESGKLTMADVKEAEAVVQKLSKKDKP
jgi:BlaI family penicillinase repressor